MRKPIRIAVVGVTLSVLALVVAGSAGARIEVVRVGNLVLKNNSAISPTKLPKRKQAPIKGAISASIATVDGTHLPAVREVVIELDRNFHVNAKGLSVCRAGQLEARNSKAARRICGRATVGTGKGLAEIAFPEQKPLVVASPLTMFNGGVRGGKTTVFVHAFLTVPVPAAIVTPVKITHSRRGAYGLHAVAKIPVIAGGAGSVSFFKLTIGRKFTFKGKRASFATASCPTGRLLAKGRVLFRDSSLLKLARVLPCIPKG
jgi:hypothetical protein